MVRTVQEALAGHEAEIQNWLNQLRAGAPAQPPDLNRVLIGRNLGEGYIRLIGRRVEVGVDWFAALRAVNIQLRAGGPQGFFVLTAFPVP